MVHITSHILNSLTGRSAVGVRSELIYRPAHGSSVTLFDTVTDEEGRISEIIDHHHFPPGLVPECELVFHGAKYFAAQGVAAAESSPVQVVVIRVVMEELNKRYHLPVMLSPHSYSLWWSQ